MFSLMEKELLSRVVVVVVLFKGHENIGEILIAKLCVSCAYKFKEWLFSFPCSIITPALLHGRLRWFPFFNEISRKDIMWEFHPLGPFQLRKHDQPGNLEIGWKIWKLKKHTQFLKKKEVEPRSSKASSKLSVKVKAIPDEFQIILRMNRNQKLFSQGGGTF